MASGSVTLLRFIVARFGALGSVYAHKAHSHRDLLNVVMTGCKWSAKYILRIRLRMNDRNSIAGDKRGSDSLGCGVQQSTIL